MTEESHRTVLVQRRTSWTGHLAQFDVEVSEALGDVPGAPISELVATWLREHLPAGVLVTASVGFNPGPVVCECGHESAGVLTLGVRVVASSSGVAGDIAEAVFVDALAWAINEPSSTSIVNVNPSAEKLIIDREIEALGTERLAEMRAELDRALPSALPDERWWVLRRELLASAMLRALGQRAAR